jgi:hypothetical protein
MTVAAGLEGPTPPEDVTTEAVIAGHHIYCTDNGNNICYLIFFTVSTTSSAAVGLLDEVPQASLLEIDVSISQPEEILTHNSSKRRRISANQYFTDSDELCHCACNRRYDSTSMSKCKGVVEGLECHKRIRRACVPLDWLCNSCRRTK